MSFNMLYNYVHVIILKNCFGRVFITIEKFIALAIYKSPLGIHFCRSLNRISLRLAVMKIVLLLSPAVKHNTSYNAQ